MFSPVFNSIFVKIAFNVSSIEKAPFTIRGAASNGIQFESVLLN